MLVDDVAVEKAGEESQHVRSEFVPREHLGEKRVDVAHVAVALVVVDVVDARREGDVVVGSSVAESPGVQVVHAVFEADEVRLRVENVDEHRFVKEILALLHDVLFKARRFDFFAEVFARLDLRLDVLFLAVVRFVDEFLFVKHAEFEVLRENFVGQYVFDVDGRFEISPAVVVEFVPVIALYVRAHVFVFILGMDEFGDVVFRGAQGIYEVILAVFHVPLFVLFGVVYARPAMETAHSQTVVFEISPQLFAFPVFIFI